MADVKKKVWYKSVTVWANLVAVLAILANEYWQVGISAEEEGTIVAFINIIIRVIATQSKLTLMTPK